MRERLTKNDVEKIQAEIEHRKLVERKELIEAVKEARSHGDLSENFEYHAAKKAKNQNESRIRYLERMLKTAEIVEDHSKEDEIGLNNTVELYCEDDDEVETYRIVTSVRGSSLNGLVSIESPIGKALLGHKEGERVYIKVNDDFSKFFRLGCRHRNLDSRLFQCLEHLFYAIIHTVFKNTCHCEIFSIKSNHLCCFFFINSTVFHKLTLQRWSNKFT